MSQLRLKPMTHGHIMRFVALFMDWTTQRQEANIHFGHKTGSL